MQLISASGLRGGLLVRDPAQSLMVTAAQSFAMHSSTAIRSVASGLEVIRLGDQEALISFGQAPGAQGYWLGGAGLGAGFTFGFAGGSLLALKSLALADGRDLIFTSSLQSLGVSSWLRSANGQISKLDQILPGNTVQGYDVQAMAVLPRQTGGLLLAVSAQGEPLTSFRIAADGRAVQIDSLGNADGLAVTAAHLLQTVRMGAQDYALLGAAGTGSVSVIRLEGDGRLLLMDQVNDDRNTRFQGISVLQTVTLQGRVFVVAGGADDGLSLMTLLPTGRLLHLAAVADTLTTALENVSALAVSAFGTGIDVFATGLSETSISQFRIETGPLAPMLVALDVGGTLVGDDRYDLILGGVSKDRLYGGAGDDILIDGAGVDQMFGGAGADVFVFMPDGDRDEVRDFNPAEDRLDLSGLGRIYSRDALSFVPLAGGIELRLAGEKIDLFSPDGQTITPDQLTDAQLFDLSHAGPMLVANPNRKILGTVLADTLLGKAGNDTLSGDLGHDTLLGAAGNDLLTGGAGNDLIDGGAGMDRAWFAGVAAVRVDLRLNTAQNTGIGWDILRGVESVSSGSGADHLQGNGFANSFGGGTGNDTLIGNGGNDTLLGGAGNDVLSGGSGKNLLFGGAGADQFCFVKSSLGEHRVQDLQRGDHIVLSGFGYGSAAALSHLSQSGSEVIFADQGLRICFANSHLADFSASMFWL